ncbi:MAG: hypothetical protein ABIN57_11250 [Chitinophagaceae bacterium]
MRKQLFTTPFFLLFTLFVVVVVLLFYPNKKQIPGEVVSTECCKKMEAIKESSLLWESLSNQFVKSSLFN